MKERFKGVTDICVGGKTILRSESMTGDELQRGNELKKEMQLLCDQIYTLRTCLCAEKTGNQGKYKKFFLNFFCKNKYSISAPGVSFSGVLTADRELLELILNYYDRKLSNLKKEFECLGNVDSQ